MSGPQKATEVAAVREGPWTLVVGDVTTDVVVVMGTGAVKGDDTPAMIRTVPGGQAANTAAWLARQGMPVTLATVVGDDAMGRSLLAELTEAGVSCSARQCSDLPTGTVVVVSSPDERTMMTDRGANRRLSVDDVDRAFAQTRDLGHVHLSAYVLVDESSRAAGLRALATARRLGLTVSVDAASAQSLDRAGISQCLDWLHDIDLLIANIHEARALAGCDVPEAAARALTHTAVNVVVKLGREGAVWAGRDRSLAVVPGRRAEAVDTTGAGDAFAAGLLAALASGADARAALAHAAELGAAVVGTVGARPVTANSPAKGRTGENHDRGVRNIFSSFPGAE